MKLVIVESPGKVKNLSQYLGKNYTILPTVGHVRSLPSKSGSVQPDENFTLKWEVLAKSHKPLSAIVKALKTADTLILATDLDREGEAIAWHILEYLKEQKCLSSDIAVQRVSFNAITKKAVLEAMKEPRELDMNLVHSYLARLSLDYLVGFTLSPVLWRKLPGSRSAGRVQSVALRVVVEREKEITNFRSQEYWSIHGVFEYNKTLFDMQMVHYEKKLQKMDITNKEQAISWEKKAKNSLYVIESLKTKRVQRHPMAPFITSSLQQDASQKLGFSPTHTMHVAQSLYEGVEIDGETLGLITYMRTDSPFIVADTIHDMRVMINDTWGKNYVAPEIRQYQSKSNAQEAHEAIRPTQINLTPSRIMDALSKDQYALYKLIWDRTIASQMASAQYDQTSLTVMSEDRSIMFRTAGSIMIFDGFLVLYKDDSCEEQGKLLPAVTVGEKVDLQSTTCAEHHTQPAPRYSESMLIKTLEELGIGRPSTYARILQVLQERDYVNLEKKKLSPKKLGIVVTAFLCYFFARYVDAHFTADLEKQLDEISSGKKEWKAVLQDFWPAFLHTIEASQKLSIDDVLKAIQKDVIGDEVKTCPKCNAGTLCLKLSKMGPFLSCSAYPLCTYNVNLDDVSNNLVYVAMEAFCQHPETGSDIFLKKGPYGWYVEHHNKKISLSPFFQHDTITPEQAVWLLSTPKTLGLYPGTENPVMVGIGRFGPYIKYEGKFTALRKKDPVSLTLEEAIEILQQPPRPPRGVKKAASAAS